MEVEQTEQQKRLEKEVEQMISMKEETRSHNLERYAFVVHSFGINRNIDKIAETIVGKTSGALETSIRFDDEWFHLVHKSYYNLNGKFYLLIKASTEEFILVPTSELKEYIEKMVRGCSFVVGCYHAKVFATEKMEKLLSWDNLCPVLAKLIQEFENKKA